MVTTAMKGTVQGYFDRAFDEMTDKELETPLANSGLNVKATLAPNPKDTNAQRPTFNAQLSG
ncbi:MAG: hypothetical protein WCK89_16705 [bacterium]